MFILNNIFFRVKVPFKWTTPWRGRRAGQRFHEIWRIPYLHRID